MDMSMTTLVMAISSPLGHEDQTETD